MRRGHTNNNFSWRNEGPRQFRPRGAGPPGFRPPRHFIQPFNDPPRFQRPPPSMLNLPVYQAQQTLPSLHQNDRRLSGNSERRPDHYRQNNRIQDERSYRYNRRDPDHYDSRNRDGYHVNTHGDVDQRSLFGDVDQRSIGDVDQRNFNPRQGGQRPSPWADDHESLYDRNRTPRTPRYDDHNKTSYKDIEDYKLPTDYTGHRPPASDHYQRPSVPAIDESFSRSVDDTVDIIKKRLKNRNDPLNQVAETENQSEQTAQQLDRFQQGTSQQEQTPRRKSHQSKHRMKTNCDKIKNKIVHQFLKMDKDRIHKLMDNPNSSTKFEYAISSLITESQNSLNRHLRSAAEKSLCGSRNVVQYKEDTDAIYEDTFMRQMQCILDPQDTVLLEDIKPFVLAELSKVLGLDGYQNYENVGDEEYDRSQAYNSYPEYPEGSYDRTELYQSQSSYIKPECTSDYETTQSPERSQSTTDYENRYFRQEETSNLFERRHRNSCEVRKKSPAPQFPESAHFRNFTPEKSQEKGNGTDPSSPEPFFNPNADPISEEEIFEELDRQYHVAIDRNYIGQDYTRSPSPMRADRSKTPQPTRPERCKTPRPTYQQSNTPIQKNIIKREPNVRDITKALKPTIMPLEDIKQETILNAIESHFKGDGQETVDSTKDISITQNKNDEKYDKVLVKKEKEDKSSRSQEEIQKPDSSTPIEIREKSPSASRKRSSDQKPSHRKEKRKKSDISPSDKQILNKNNIINLNECPTKKTAKCDTNTKSVFNLNFSKGDEGTSKEVKNKDGTESEYSDKYVKRKEEPKTPKDKRSKSKQRTNSTSSNHSIISPKENTASQTPTKNESKTKYQSIDIFTEQPRKSNQTQIRNTASITLKPTSSLTTPQKAHKKPELKTYSKHEANKEPNKLIPKKQNHKETQTMNSLNLTTRYIQTDKKKTITRGAQTDPISLQAKVATSPFERMKEIDLEIQNLLQEKFGLYNSLESKESTSNPMQNLGMAVLSVANNDVSEADNNAAENAIIDDFTNIPADELEQIALESTAIHEINTRPRNKKTRKQILQEENRKRSISPATKRKKARTPNISLLEQIITDDRPIEDIISLDDLETSPVKTYTNKKKKNTKATKKRVIAYPETKECSVVLLREDLSKKMRPKKEKESKVSDHSYSSAECIEEEVVPPIDFDKEIVDVIVDTVVEAVQETVAESVVIEEPLNEFHFDMLEVSEDIVIGDIDKVEKDSAVVAVSEDIVLDNSQSGDDTSNVEPEAQPTNSACKMYDYSADEDLKHDSVTVSGHADAVLAIECIDNSFLAACLDGSVYHFSSDGQLLTTLRGSNLAVTCLTIVQEKYGTTVYTGSLDSRIRYYDLDTGRQKGPECNVLSPIQTMDRAWDTVFVGTRTGFVLQFECRNNMLIPISTIKFSEQSILALRALKEGPRKVLLVASRSENVTIKDAQTGLLLRTLHGPKMTVYTLLYEDGKVFCGTSSNMIQVFDYTSGSHTGEHEGGKGAVCLRCVGGVLFAGCYDGCVYVFRAGSTRPLAQLRGPGVMLLSLAVHGGKMIAGYKDRSLYIWKIPDNILQEMIL